MQYNRNILQIELPDPITRITKNTQVDQLDKFHGWAKTWQNRGLSLQAILNVNV